MPTLSSSNRVQVGIKLEGVYPTNYGVLQGGNGLLVNITGESLSFDVKTEKSKILRADRQVTDLIQVGASAAGALNFEENYRDGDLLTEAALQSTYVVYGTNGVSAAIASLTMAATTLTAGAAPAGADAFTALIRGQWFGITPAAGTAQNIVDYCRNRAWRVSTTVAPTSTVITLDPTTPFNTALGGATLANARISSSRLTNGVTMRTFSIEVNHTDLGNVFRQYMGMSPNKIDLKFSAGSIVSGSIEFMGRTMTLASATGMGTPTAASAYPSANAVKGVFDVVEGSALISASTYIKAGELSISNNLRAQEAVGVFGNAGVGTGTFDVTGKLEVYFADALLYNKFLNNTVTQLCIPVLDPLGNGYVYCVCKAKYTAAKVNASGADQDNMLSIDFIGLMDSDTSSPTYQKTLAIYRIGD
jgi:hypothetical protein